MKANKMLREITQEEALRLADVLDMREFVIARYNEIVVHAKSENQAWELALTEAEHLHIDRMCALSCS